jgi:hypothetical protein
MTFYETIKFDSFRKSILNFRKTFKYALIWQECIFIIVLKPDSLVFFQFQIEKEGEEKSALVSWPEP